MVSIRQASDAVLRTRTANVARTLTRAANQQLSLRASLVVIVVLSLLLWQIVFWGLRFLGL